MELLRPKVATAVLVFREGKILLGRRKGDAKASGFGTPGGHIEHLEGLFESAQREIAEEAAIEVENLEMIGLVNVREFAPLHHFVVILRADWKSGEPVNCEPDRCEGWSWFDLEKLPSPMTPATEKGIEGFKNGQMFFE